MSNVNPADFEALSRVFRHYESEIQRTSNESAIPPRTSPSGPTPAQRTPLSSMRQRPFFSQQNSPPRLSPDLGPFFQIVAETKKRVDEIYCMYA